MKKNLPLIVAGGIILGLFILLQVVVVVREGEVAVLTHFGQPKQELTESGKYYKLPWPIQKVYSFDGRYRSYETQIEETITADKKNVLIAVYIGWRIEKPQLFLEKVGSEKQALDNLDGLIRSYRSALIGQTGFSALVNTNREAMAFSELEEELLAQIGPEALELYGIGVATLGIHRLGLPEQNTKSVFDRMNADLKWEAEKYRAQGNTEAEIIRARADADRAGILAEARRKAKELRAEGDFESAKFYESFNKNPDLAKFLKELETIEEVFDDETTVILSTETVPFNQLKAGRQTEQKQPE